VCVCYWSLNSGSGYFGDGVSQTLPGLASNSELSDLRFPGS
jgi:hypothetical protein